MVHDISIHAAREGGDTMWPVFFIPHKKFQSTPPVKAATYVIPANIDDFVFQSTPPVKAATPKTINYRQVRKISIHAAREGGDTKTGSGDGAGDDFNPRRP